MFIFLTGLNGVRLVNVNVPSYRFRGENAVLKCIYDLEGEQLYSVKWYKDGSEFFRYIPGDPDQRITTFSLPGVTVDVRINAYMLIQTLNYRYLTYNYIFNYIKFSSSNRQETPIKIK